MIGIRDLIFFIALGLLLFSFSSCDKKPEATISWAFFDLETEADLLSITMESCDKWHVVGGKSWSKGIYIQINQQTESFTNDSLIGKRLNAISSDDKNNLYTVGYTGFSLTQNSNTWQIHHLFDNLNILRDIDMWNDSIGIAVSGVSYNNGHFYWLGKNQTVVESDSTGQSLRAVKLVSPTKAIAVGYGTLLKITKGKNWERLPYYGDFFMDVDFPSPSVGYVIGNAGSILKTKDGGDNWEFLTKKNTVSNNTAFRAIHFIDEQNGYIVGEHGLLWRTTDGAKTWVVGTGLPDIEFYDIDVCAEIGVLVGKGGKLITFDPNF